MRDLNERKQGSCAEYSYKVRYFSRSRRREFHTKSCQIFFAMHYIIMKEHNVLFKSASYFEKNPLFGYSVKKTITWHLAKPWWMLVCIICLLVKRYGHNWH